VRSESSTSFSLRGAKVPGNESSRERKYQRAKVPAMELLLLGAKVCGNENSSYQFYINPQYAMQDWAVKITGHYSREMTSDGRSYHQDATK